MKYTGERMIPGANKKEEMYLEHMSRYFFASQFVKNKVILDIACGSGYGADLLLQAGAKKVIGVDISEESIAFCRENYKRENLEFIAGSVTDIPLKDKSIDIVVSFETIEHVNEENQLQFLKETKRILNTDGLFIVSNPNPLIYPKGNPFHIKELSLDEFKGVLGNYFSETKIFYQDDVNSSYILSECNVKKEIIFEEEGQPKVRKINSLKPLDSSFLIAVCANSKINHRIDEYVTMFNLKAKDEVQRVNNEWRELVRKKDEITKQIAHDVEEKKREIKSAELKLWKKEQEKAKIKYENYAKRKELEKLLNEFEQKKREIIFMKSSKFWILRNRYLKLKSFRLKYFSEIIKKDYWIFKREGTKSFFWHLYKYAIHGRDYFNPQKRDFSEYDAWIEENEKWNKNKIEKEIKKFEYKPKISIIIPVYNVDSKWLNKCIQSVCDQFYENWELCLHDDASTKKETIECLKKWKEKDDSRIKVSFGKENQHISGASNEALKLATGEFVALLDNDDEISSDALFENVKILNKYPDTDFIYSDEDKIDEKGDRSNPFFKPNWSPDLFHCVNYICHFTVMRKSIGDKIGWFRKGYEGSQDFDLFLRFLDETKKICHIPKIMYHWRTLETSTARDTKSKSYAHQAGRQALKDYVDRNNIKAKVIDGFGDTNHHLKYDIPESAMVSIIIPFKDKVGFLKKCVESILEKTLYKNYELILVSNNSQEKETFEYLKEIGDEENIKIFEHNIPFNFSELNNWAVEKAQGNYILFLNNDTEVISPVWLEEMLGHASRKEVGAVGAKLLFPNGTIQHAGVILGIGGLADHIFSKQFANETYCNLANFTRNYLAVTAACLMISKEKFLEVGGFNEKFTVCGNDVDLCLNLYEKGYLNVYTPRAELYHYESLSRDKEPPQCDIDISLKRYAPYINWNDPYYNKNLSLGSKDARLRISSKWRDRFFQKETILEESVEDKYQKIKFEEQKNLISAIDLSSKELEEHFKIVNNQEESSGKIKTINWLLPNYSHVLFGGIYTILRFANYFQEKKGIKNRIVIFDNPNIENVNKKKEEAIKEFPALKEAEFMAIEKANDLLESDAVVSTFWPSCYISARFNKTKKKFYFIQDYEPLFYSAGSIYAMAEATYRMGFRGIVNTLGLAEYIRQQHKMNCQEFYPCVNDRIYNIGEEGLEKKLQKKTLDIFIYGRPNHDRNAFELGLLTLTKLKEKYGDRINIISAGDDWKEEDFGVKGIIQNLGRLGKLNAVADLYRKCDIGLVFMFTKHPSYQPFEFMACGCATVTNFNSANGWFLKDGENAMVSEPEPSCFVDKISKLIEDKELREKIVRNGLKEIKKHNWDEECEKIYEYIRE